MTAAERVARGAALLDKRMPGWAARIDLSVLDLANECRCVLGQLWTGDDDPYVTGLRTLDLVDGGRPYGFVTGDVGNIDDALAEYRELDELWIAEIQRRREVAP